MNIQLCCKVVELIRLSLLTSNVVFMPQGNSMTFVLHLWFHFCCNQFMLEEAMHTMQKNDASYWGKLHIMSNDSVLLKFLLRESQIVLDNSETDYNGFRCCLMKLIISWRFSIAFIHKIPNVLERDQRYENYVVFALSFASKFKVQYFEYISEVKLKFNCDDFTVCCNNEGERL